MNRSTTNDKTPCHIEKSPARDIAEAFVNTISTVYLRCDGDFAQFCNLLDLNPDKYSAEKWRLLNRLVEQLNNFDLQTLTKIVEVGSLKSERLTESENPKLWKPQDLHLNTIYRKDASICAPTDGNWTTSLRKS